MFSPVTVPGPDDLPRGNGESWWVEGLPPA